jgi:glutamate-ammonia-ligase adenylyltransferase
MVVVPLQLVDLAERSADPERVRAALVRLDRAHPDLVAADGVAERLVAVAAASRSLTELLLSDPAARSAVLAPGEREAVPTADRDMADVVGWSRRELLRIAVLDLTGRQDLDATTVALSAMAVDVLVAAHGRTAVAGRLAIVGMGKLGGGELNYASDVDLLLVGEGERADLERAGRSLVALAGRCFRVDVDLRPEGRDGPLVRTTAGYRSYWERWADPWERQALLRATPVAGDADLGAEWAAAADDVLWGQPFTADDLRHVRRLKVRAEEAVRHAGLADREVKRGPGGIRDVEFAAQLLQLVHGRADTELRTPTTRVALRSLADGGYVDPDDARQLGDSYAFLRRVEHVLQLDELRQTHTVPKDRSARRHVARVLGYRGERAGGPTELFDRDLARHRAQVRSVHERVWFRPLLASLAGVGPLGAEAVGERLAAFGFTDPERTRQAVEELTRGLTRSSRMMAQLLPLLLDWLSASPDPDLGLLAVRRLASGEQRSRALAGAFRESPEVARQLALVVGTSRELGDILVANPDLTERLADPHRLATRARAALVDSALAGTAWRVDLDRQQQGLQRWLRRNLLGVAARDVLGHAPLEVVGHDLTALAEASLEATLHVLAPRVPFAVVAFGRLGGGELGYPSDLDVAFVHGGQGAADAEEAERVAAGVMRFLGGATPAERIWTVDATLRPEGRNGPLARSLEGWQAYVARWASTWERQAHLRMRAVAGDPDVGAALATVVDHAIWSVPFDDADAREVRRMKARIERERTAGAGDPEFNLKLGRGTLSDVEFTVQLLQLHHGVPGAATLDSLGRLAAAGHIEATDASVLAEAYRFCDRTRNRRYLVAGAGDTLPLRPEQLTPLARSLGFTVPALREEYRRLTRRARRVVEQRFYGAG